MKKVTSSLYPSLFSIHFPTGAEEKKSYLIPALISPTPTSKKFKGTTTTEHNGVGYLYSSLIRFSKGERGMRFQLLSSSVSLQRIKTKGNFRCTFPTLK